MTSAAPEGGGTRVIGTLNSTASTTFDLDFYANPSCRARPRAFLQAETYLGSIQVTTDGSGNATFNVLLPTPIEAGSPVTATATDANGNTSEFWQEIVLQGDPRASAARATRPRSRSPAAVRERRHRSPIGGRRRQHVRRPTRIDFVGAVALAGRRVRRHRDEPERARPARFATATCPDFATCLRGPRSTFTSPG